MNASRAFTGGFLAVVALRGAVASVSVEMSIIEQAALLLGSALCGGTAALMLFGKR